MKYEPIDLSGVKTYPLAERKNKVVMARHRSGPVRAGMTVRELMAALPDQLASGDRRHGRPRDQVWSAAGIEKPD